MTIPRSPEGSVEADELSQLKLRIAELEQQNAQLQAEVEKLKPQTEAQNEQQHWTSLFMQAPALIALQEGPEHVFVLVNPLAQQLLGGRDVTGLPVREAVPEVEEQGFVTLLDRVYQTGEPFIGKETRVKLHQPDGSIKDGFFNMTYQPWYDEAGRVIGVMTFALEVSEQVQARQVIEANETYFRTLTEVIPQIVWASGPDSEVDFFNQKWYDYTGLTPEQSYGQQWLKLVHPDDLRQLYNTWSNLPRPIPASTNAPATLEYRLRRKDGVYRWHLARSLPVRDSQGRIIRWFGTATDIDDQKRAEQNQRFLADASRILSSSIDYEATLQNIAHLIVPFLADWCTIDVIGESGQISSLGVAHSNPTHEAMVQELARRYWTEFVTEEQLLPHVQRSGQSILLSEMPPGQFEKPIYKPEHRALLQQLGVKSLLAVPLVTRGQILGDVMLVRSAGSEPYNQADLELAEELGRRAAQAIDNARLYQEARKAIEDRNEFLSVAAHELKTPLTGLSGFVQLLNRQLAKTGTLEPARVEKALQTINQQTAKLIRLLGQLLDVSRIEAGRLVLAPAPTDLTGLVQEVIATAQAATQQHTLSLKAPERLVAQIDPMRFEQVVVNLVDNAIKYSPEGGLIDLELSLTEARMVRLSITDRGSGIPLEHQANIFERFYQAQQGYQQKGMGLGLHITRQIIELHGGKIELESPVAGDSGTRFVILVPQGKIE